MTTSLWQAGDVLEIALPLKELEGDVSFVVRVERELDGQRAIVEQHPRFGPIVVARPGADFDAKHWST